MPEMIRVQGLRQIRRRLELLADPDKTAEFSEAGRAVAQLIVAKAQARAGGMGPREARAAATLEPASFAAGAGVLCGGAPGAFGSEFGADRNQRRAGRPGGEPAGVHGWNQFRPWKGSGPGAGYFLWPTIRSETDEVLDIYGQALDDIWEADDGSG